MSLDFAHLHVHTHLSPDGLGTPDKLVKLNKELGYSSLSITDHGTLGGVVEFVTACNDFSIKPIIGLEAYHYYNGKRHHVTLNSTTKRGYKNLVNLNNRAHAENFVSGYPLVTLDLLSSTDLTDISIFTGCPASPIHNGSEIDGSNWVGVMCDLFGRDNLFIEMMCVIDEDFTSRPYSIARRFNLPIILTNDVHFASKDLQPIHPILTECRKGYTYSSDQLWLKSPSEIFDSALRFFDGDEIKHWMGNAYEFSQNVETWSIFSDPKLPNVKHLHSNFLERVEKSFLLDVAGMDKEGTVLRRNRLNIELQALRNFGFLDYFIILDDIVQFAHSKNIVIGPGRGSAAGSYILYLLGVTGINPIEHNLFFERFLNIKRVEYPDVDLDFESDRRNEVLEYANNKWGGISIAAYSHYSHKVLINDISRNLHIKKELSVLAGERGNESKAFDAWANSNENARLAYMAMDGQVRHASKHAGGMVIVNKKDQDIPIEMIKGELVAAWTEGKDKELSKVGIIKFDILGVTALSQLKEMRRLVDNINFSFPPKDNDPLFDIFCNGEVLGIFQWTGSEGIKNLTKRISPRTFLDLVIINSLYRPGALDAGTADLYPDLKNNPRLFGDPRIDNILSGTRGVIVFQEDVMEVFSTVIGGSFEDGDVARRIIFKPKENDPKWIEEFNNLRESFFTNGLKNNFLGDILHHLWGEIVTHTRYSFNRSHSTAYAAIACEMAYFKYYHPLVFYAVCLTYDQANAQSYFMEMVRKNIDILLPDIQYPTDQFMPVFEQNAVRIPLNLVKFCGVNSVKKIIKEVEKNGSFDSIEDFRQRIPSRVCNTRMCRNLYYIGAFDKISEGDPLSLFDNNTSEELIFSKEKRQMESLGFILPTKKIVNYIDKFQDNENIKIGFIKDWKDKRNKWGNAYRVYYLLPSGIFWAVDHFDRLEKGDFVKVLTTNYGKAIKRQKLKIIGE